MRVLIVKTSSLGDVVHMLPAVSDAARHGYVFDWVVEEQFSAIPGWHPQVEQGFPAPIRRWRGQWRSRQTWREIGALRSQLKKQDYAAVIDSQGLYKSALLATWAKGRRWGYDWHSAREPLVALLYHRGVRIPKGLHAIERNRRLLATALNYRHEDLPLDYGLLKRRAQLAALPCDFPHPFVVGLHGTTRTEKECPESHWHALGGRLGERGVSLVLPWGNAKERERACRISQTTPAVRVLPQLNLDALAGILTRAVAVVGVDTGLIHLAAALGCPGLALFISTDPARTGVMTMPQAAPLHNLAKPESMRLETVWQALGLFIAEADTAPDRRAGQ